VVSFGAVATDLARILGNLLAFFDFSDAVMISCGAGGGQLAEYGRTARKVIAVDIDPKALDRLRDRLRSLGLEDKFELIQSDFCRISRSADVVLFEVSLHELPDPARALRHAAALAKAVVVLDHAPGSEWSSYVLDSEKVEISWREVERFGIVRKNDYEATQTFANYEELAAKVASAGEGALRQIERFRTATKIELAMPYRIALLKSVS
jgi:ubiquinone/menaquinone biosynthesis C-methylase UbiE